MLHTVRTDIHDAPHTHIENMYACMYVYVVNM